MPARRTIRNAWNGVFIISRTATGYVHCAVGEMDTENDRFCFISPSAWAWHRSPPTRTEATMDVRRAYRDTGYLSGCAYLNGLSVPLAFALVVLKEEDRYWFFV
jgi:hypothetical protein